MTRFSANLGFLWTDRSLPDAIHAAKTAGFDAVECHWPYDYDPVEIRTALDESEMRMLGINTRRGNVEAGDFGLSALPGRAPEALAAIDEALEFAVAIGAENVHVMAGLASGRDAHQTFLANLAYATKQAATNGITILIEPINHYDAPDYFLKTTGQAAQIITEVTASNLKLMFDCYHVQLMEGDLTRRLQNLLPVIGHIQFASVPDRGPPGNGEIDYRYIFQLIESLGYTHPLGAEYKPQGDTEASLGWLSELTDRQHNQG